jgi:Transposase
MPLSQLEAQNLDTNQAMQIRMNLQQLFTMSVKSARRFLDRWNAWVQVGDLAPVKEAGQDDHGQVGTHPQFDRHRPSNGVLEAINGNVQAAKRKAKATAPNETSKPSSTSSPGTCSLIHSFEIATSRLRCVVTSTKKTLLSRVAPGS